MKTTRPCVPEALVRHRVFSLLDAGVQRPIVWVQAPAGFGKTTLISSYVEAKRLPTVWVQLDAGDADPATFFHYLELAVKTAAPRFRTPLPLFSPEYLPSPAVFVRRYFHEVFRRLPPACVLVFDDYQDVPADALLHTLMRHAFDEIPAGAHVIVASRQEPPPALARHRASAALSLLGVEDLRLSAEETVDITREHGLDLDPATLALIHTQAQGWAAGLVLLVEHCKQAAEIPATLDHASLSAVFDYFAGEVFAGMPPATREVLLKTALLPRVGSAVAQALTGEARAAEILAVLAHTKFFTVRHGPATFQYHPLLREFLLAQAKKTYTAAYLAQLRRQAAQFLETEGQPEEAIELWLEAADWAAAGRLIGRLAPELLAQGRRQTLETWLAALPGASIDADPWLCYWLGVCRSVVAPIDARASLEAAFERFAARGDELGQIMAATGMIEAYFFDWGNFAPLDRWIGVLEHFVERDFAWPSRGLELRVLLWLSSALMYRKPDHPLLPVCAERAMHELAEEFDPSRKLAGGAWLLNYYDWLGDPAAAERVVAQLRPLLAKSQAAPLSEVFWDLTCSFHKLLAGTFDEAAGACTHAHRLMQDHGLHFLSGSVLVQQAICALSSGDLGGAAAALAELEACALPIRRLDTALAMMARAQLALLRGEPQAALTYAQAAVDCARETGTVGVEAFSLLVLAVMLAENGRHGEARERIRTARQHMGGMGGRLIRYNALIIEAYLALLAGDTPAADTLVAKCFALGAQAGYLGCLIATPGILARLAAHALRQDIERDYAHRLIRACGLLPPASELEHWPWRLEIRTFGRFLVLKDGSPIQFSGKAQKRPLELLKCLLALGSWDVPEASLACALWPDAEGDAAHQSLNVTLHRLRKLLGCDKAIRCSDNRITLDPRYCWVDTWAFERLLGDTDALEPGDEAACQARVRRAIALYQGAFLAGDTDSPWSASMRERLRSKFIRHVGRLAERLEAAGEVAQAAEHYRRGLEVDDLAEAFYQRLMRCYLHQGMRAEGLRLYQRLRQSLSLVLGIRPSPESEALRQRLQVE